MAKTIQSAVQKRMLSSWLTEVFKRFGLTSPAFFQVWQTIGLLAVGIGFIPDALVWLDITPNEVISKYISFGVKVAGAVTWLMAKLPVSDPNVPVKAGEVVSKTKALPFTTQKKLNGKSNKTGTRS